ncbi:hypothetical protein [Patulibacter defluvii]|uniref:hypothetical protein n=1 Tax=Patulibacter defluvii TaxID=3095358 RepID=UPI002A75E4B1|nr:hypothetical protein [Patulibacter sp. DM4]
MAPRFRTRRGGTVAALLVSAAALAAVPAPAGATLVYTKGTAHQSVWVAADDGSGARRIAAGSTAHVSDDGSLVSWATPMTSAGDATLRVAPAAGGPARDLLPHFQWGAFAWSPDGRWIAATTGRELGRRRLVLVDVASGRRRTIARGWFSGASFSPDSTQLVYDLRTRDDSFPRSDLHVATVADGRSRRLTSDGHSQVPVWGPTAIAYARWARPTGRHRHEDGPKYNLRLIRPDGSGRRTLTRQRIPWLLSGLFPTAFSADGQRLLAEFGGQDTSYAVAVDVASGRTRRLGDERGPIGGGLSRDGSTILAVEGGLEDTATARVVAIPFDGGPRTLLARGGYDPDWNR